MYSNVLSIVVLTFSVLLALALIFYLIKVGPGVWGQQDFTEEKGAVFEGTTVKEFIEDGKSQPHLIILPIINFLRLLIFILILLRLKSFLG